MRKILTSGVFLPFEHFKITIVSLIIMGFIACFLFFVSIGADTMNHGEYWCGNPLVYHFDLHGQAPTVWTLIESGVLSSLFVVVRLALVILVAFMLTCPIFVILVVASKLLRYAAHGPATGNRLVSSS